MSHSPGTVGIFTDSIARFSDFSIAIRGLRVPEGTEFHWARGVYLAYNTNDFIRNMKGDWLMLMDDDHRFEPDFLEKLLDHDKDVVVAHTSKKLPPYPSVLYKFKNGQYEHLKIKGKSGLVEVDACGKPGMLIKRHVLEAMEDPWCEYAYSDVGEEDFNFCGKIREAGFKIYADLDLPLGHMAPLAAYKVRQDGQWGTALNLDRDNTVFIGDA